VCGEEKGTNRGTIDIIGTPPRVWGRENHGYEYEPEYGDTPTCVGKRNFISRAQMTR